ncbi:MAG: hypothetical protein P8130_14155 [Deltaproteobacteria bacterium]
MYLARIKTNNRIKFEIRQSVPDRRRHVLTNRTLMDLGEAPWSYIVYPGGNAFYIDEKVEEELGAAGVSYEYTELEEMFWPFVDPGIRAKLEPFMARGSKKSGAPKAESGALARIHPFDKRRLYYLRCGHMDQSDLQFITDKLFTPLLGKSRDELEQYFLAMERMLRSRELKSYVFVIFGLARELSGSKLFRTMPEALDEEKLDEAFMQQYCKLQSDKKFWSGMNNEAEAQFYLSRYVIMFFDYHFAARSVEQEFLRDFINSRRRYAPPARKVKVAPEEVKTLFGKTAQELRAMNKAALTRLFRRRAKKLHPDAGGDHETFVRLTAVYEEFKRQAKK